jgi:hypothetical protein
MNGQAQIGTFKFYVCVREILNAREYCLPAKDWYDQQAKYYWYRSHHPDWSVSTLTVRDGTRMPADMDIRPEFDVDAALIRVNSEGAIRNRP